MAHASMPSAKTRSEIGFEKMRKPEEHRTKKNGIKEKRKKPKKLC